MYSLVKQIKIMKKLKTNKNCSILKTRLLIQPKKFWSSFSFITRNVSINEITARNVIMQPNLCFFKYPDVFFAKRESYYHQSNLLKKEHRESVRGLDFRFNQQHKKKFFFDMLKKKRHLKKLKQLNIDYVRPFLRYVAEPVPKTYFIRIKKYFKNKKKLFRNKSISNKLSSQLLLNTQNLNWFKALNLTRFMVLKNYIGFNNLKQKRAQIRLKTCLKPGELFFVKNFHTKVVQKFAFKPKFLNKKPLVSNFLFFCKKNLSTYYLYYFSSNIFYTKSIGRVKVGFSLKKKNFLYKKMLGEGKYINKKIFTKFNSTKLTLLKKQTLPTTAVFHRFYNTFSEESFILNNQKLSYSSFLENFSKNFFQSFVIPRTYYIGPY